MYCRNCGVSFDSSLTHCPSCDVPKGMGQDFCSACGKAVSKKSEFCPRCGAVLTANLSAEAAALARPKSRLKAGLLGFFLGAFGAHSFYLGNIKKGVLQLILTVLTVGIGGFWGFFEGILILAGVINVTPHVPPR